MSLVLRPELGDEWTVFRPDMLLPFLETTHSWPLYKSSCSSPQKCIALEQKARMCTQKATLLQSSRS